MNNPGELREYDIANFDTIRRAEKDGNLALVSAIRKSDGKQVALLCAIGFDGKDYLPSPLAVMIDGNPFELFEDPFSD